MFRHSCERFPQPGLEERQSRWLTWGLPPLAPSLGGGPPRLGDPGQARDTVERGGQPAGGRSLWPCDAGTGPVVRPVRPLMRTFFFVFGGRGEMKMIHMEP